MEGWILDNKENKDCKGLLKFEGWCIYNFEKSMNFLYDDLCLDIFQHAIAEP